MAHVDHLGLYAGGEGYPDEESPDPRHFASIRGTAPTVESLGGHWAPSEEYGENILALMEEIWDVEVTEPTSEPTTEPTTEPNDRTYNGTHDRAYRRPTSTSTTTKPSENQARNQARSLRKSQLKHLLQEPEDEKPIEIPAFETAEETADNSAFEKAEYMDLLDRLILAEHDYGLTGIQLAIYKDGKLIKNNAYGYLNNLPMKMQGN